MPIICPNCHSTMEEDEQCENCKHIDDIECECETCTQFESEEAKKFEAQRNQSHSSN